jgi:hypothetical protein
LREFAPNHVELIAALQAALAPTSAVEVGVICENCGGEGTLYTSKYRGNDPDVWPIGTCEECEGTGKCQYAEAVAMPEYRCVDKCQYAATPVAAPVSQDVRSNALRAAIKECADHVYSEIYTAYGRDIAQAAVDALRSLIEEGK